MASSGGQDCPVGPTHAVDAATGVVAGGITTDGLEVLDQDWEAAFFVEKRPGCFTVVAIGPTLNAQAPIVRFVNKCEVCQRNDGVGVAWSEAGRGVAAAGETPTMGVVVESRDRRPLDLPPRSLESTQPSLSAWNTRVV